jgi:hypothetical protein
MPADDKSAAADKPGRAPLSAWSKGYTVRTSVRKGRDDSGVMTAG